MLGGRWIRPLPGLIARERDALALPGGEVLIDPSGEVTPLPPRPWPSADSPLGLLAPGDALRVADAHTGLRSTWPISPQADPADVGPAIGARLISEGAEPTAVMGPAPGEGSPRPTLAAREPRPGAPWRPAYDDPGAIRQGAVQGDLQGSPSGEGGRVKARRPFPFDLPGAGL